MVTQLLALGERLQQSGVDSAQNGATAASATGPSRPAAAEALSDSPASDLKRRRSFGSGLNAARNRRPGLGQRRDVAHLPLGASRGWTGCVFTPCSFVWQFGCRV